ncbi:MAG: hypothetical protein GY847_02070 [Proteobacteria bacterium]|nr:hypothetical protein [Pseudomonadota bacterium]
MSLPQSHEDFVLEQLCNRVPNEKRQSTDGGLVVILGAGASMEYGLPSLDDLLNKIWDDLYGAHKVESESREPAVSEKRQKLEKLFTNLGSGELRKLLSPFLRKISGAACPGYHYLVRLAKYGIIHTIVNMNFDLLLLEACNAEGVIPNITQSFNESLASSALTRKGTGKNKNTILHIVTPNGSLKEKGGAPILDLANSYYFKNQGDVNAARELFTRNHVLLIGYSCIDEKIREALWNRDTSSGAEGDKKLFVVDPAGPRHPLPLIQETRKSKDLYLHGSEASFSYFMEQFYMMADSGEESWMPTRVESKRVRAPHTGNPTHSERKSLDACRNLALQIRSSLDVADWEAGVIETHAEDLYLKVTELARCSEIPLTAAEHYLAKSASFFHDLGFFWARSRERKSEYPGFTVLKEHGKRSVTLLHRILSPDNHNEDKNKRKNIIPAHYSEKSKREMIELILNLCEYHTDLRVEQQGLVNKNREIEVDGFKVPVRFHLVCALFTLAEEMIRGEPRTESEQLHAIMVNELTAAIDDPIIDLYWNEQGVKIGFKVLEKGILYAQPSEPRAQSKAGDWLLSRVEKAVNNVNSALSIELEESMITEVRLETFPLVLKGAEKSDECSAGPHKWNERRQLQDALYERMMKSIEALRGQLEKPDEDIHDIGATVLDLLSIYILPRPKLPTDEPRAEITGEDFQYIAGNFSIPDDPGEVSRKSILYYYFLARKARARAEKAEGEDVMEDFFCRMLEERLYPTWRYLANLSNLSVDQIDVFPTICNLGSSRYRPEFSFALKHLVRDKFDSRDKFGPKGRYLYGHDGCMECTGRLLYALAVARERLCDRDLEVIVPGFGKYLSGIMAFLLEKPDKEDWFGLYGEHNKRSDNRIQQLSYFSWGILGVVRTLSAERRVRMRAGDDSWIASLTESTAEDLVDLVKMKWQDICNMSRRELQNLSFESGGPAKSLMLMGLCCIDIQKESREWPDWQDYSLPEFLRNSTLLKNCILSNDGTNDDWECRCSAVDQYRLIPAALAVWDSKKDDAWVERLVRTVVICDQDPLWIEDGVCRGSWGYSGEVSNDVAASLIAFWRHAFENREEFSRAFVKLKSVKPELFNRREEVADNATR